MKLLVDKKTGKGVSAVMGTCLAVEKPNRTIGPLVLATAIDTAPRRPPHPRYETHATNPNVDKTSDGAPETSEQQASEKATLDGKDATETKPPAFEYLESEGVL